ncbi:hypothetical protein V2J09_020501 [Rumex salicifolius]
MDKKLSFSIPKSASSKANRNPLRTSRTFTDNDGHGNENNSSHRFITEFDSSDKSLGLSQDSSKTHKRIIAPIENEYMPGKRMKNLDLPLRSAARSGGDVDFEPDSSVDAANEGAGTNMSYGLNIRQSGKDEAGYEGHERGQIKESIDRVLLKKLKDDINRLPDDDEGFDQFEEVPIEGFGAALMAGYGWKDGMGIGRSAKQDVKVVEYKRWAGRGGLGAFSDVDVSGSQKDNGTGLNSGVKKEKGRDEGKPKNAGFPIGKELRIIGGRDIGLKGRVMEELSGDGFLLLALSRSKEQVRVSPADVAELGSSKEEKCLQKLEELRNHDARANKRGKDSDTSDKERKVSRRSAEERRKDDVGHVKRDRVSKGSWLSSHIMVRVISQQFKRGKFYLKKGKVLDVVGPTTCDISMDDGKEIIQGVEQDMLETALPRRGGYVLVLSGKHKGVYGSLVKKDSESETGVVQDADTQELLNVRLDQIAEYVGDPSDIGY